MSGPRRLLDDAPSELTRALLSAAREEAPSDAALKRTLTAVGAGAAVLGSGAAAGATAAKVGAAASAAKVATKGGIAGAGLFMKWAGVGLATGIATATIVETARAPEPPPVLIAREEERAEGDRSVPAIPREPALDAWVPSEADGSVEDEGGPESGEAEERPEAPSRSRAEVTPSPSSVKSSPSARAKSTIAAEVLALDRARVELAQGRPNSALLLLDACEEESPGGRSLIPEALYLRAEALLSAGRTDDAALVAERLLALDPRGPYAERARVIAKVSAR